MSASNRKKRWGWILAGAGAALLALVTGFSSGVGSKLADAVGSSDDDAPLLTYSVIELTGKCTGGTFLPRSQAAEALRQAPPEDWTILDQEPGAAFVNRSSLSLSVQGESARTITLTGIEFDVTRQARPPGAVFGSLCGGPTVGRALEVDLDANPPRVVNSSAEEDGMLESKGPNGERLTRPIRFPWTVSVTDPLLLDIIATTESCYCTWRAEIPWVSGAERGAILIDNDGEGYTVTEAEGVPSYIPSWDGWRRNPYAR